MPWSTLISVVSVAATSVRGQSLQSAAFKIQIRAATMKILNCLISIETLRTYKVREWHTVITSNSLNQG